jgi:uncharacterized protein RhaS with RHS repeats
VAKISAPYYDGSSPLFTTYTYDALDRLVKTTNPDGTVTTLSYALAPAASDVMQVTATDETSHQQVYTLDAHGKMTKRIKLKGTVPVLTEYRRVGLGRIVRMVGSAPSFSNVIRSSVFDFLLSATRLTCTRL